MEDLLTSSVFGALSYAPPEVGLIPVLAVARDSDGNKPLADIAHVEIASYEFWPWLDEEGCIRCEPDVLITLHHPNGEKTIILVEAKFHHGKSSLAGEEQAPRDQLAREWDNLASLASKEHAQCFLVYVTADMGFPTGAVDEARAEYSQKRSASLNVLWISWRQIPNVLTGVESRILRDMVDVVKRLDLVFYRGFAPVTPMTIPWQFKKADRHWLWSYISQQPVYWTFGNLPFFDWPQLDLNPGWRFVP